MNQLRVDNLFSEALRAELVSQVKKESPAAKRTRNRVWLGTGALVGAGLLGIGVAAAGLFFIPGGKGDAAGVARDHDLYRHSNRRAGRSSRGDNGNSNGTSVPHSRLV